MRRLSLLGGLVLICASAVGQKFDGGIYAGINTSQITGDDLAGYDKLSAAFGGFARRSFNERWAMTMELGYLGKGSRKNISPRDSVPTFYLLRLHYIEVPLMVQYTWKEQLTLEAGPSVGVLFKWYEEDTFGELSGPYSSRQQFKPLDFSFALGVMWWFNERWAISVRNANTMFPVRDHDLKSSYRLNQGQYSSSIMGRLVMLF